MSENTERSDSFIIDFWSCIFGFLKKISIFELVRWVAKKSSARFVEFWVLGNLIAAILSTLLVYYMGTSKRIVLYIVLVYGALRVFEIIIYQLNVLLFDQYRHNKKHRYDTKEMKQENPYVLESVLRTVILLIQNYIEVIFWYASIMLALLHLGGNTLDVSWVEYIRSNILCVVVFDQSSILELVGDKYSVIANIIFLEIISGVIMTLLSLARFIGIMPGVETRDSKDPNSKLYKEFLAILPSKNSEYRWIIEIKSSCETHTQSPENIEKID